MVEIEIANEIMDYGLTINLLMDYQMNENHAIFQHVSPLNKETLWGNVATQLKSLIFSQQLQQGSKLPSERELAQIFNVSRVVIKQALLALEHSGFIETKVGAKGGNFVIYDPCKSIKVFIENSINIDGLTISHFNELRKALEFRALKSAIKNATEEDIENLSRINHSFTKPENQTKHSEVNIAFHMAIVELSKNPLFINILKPLLEMILSFPDTTIPKNFVKKVNDDHEKMIEAIKEKDVEKALQYLEKNINRVNA